MAHGGKDKGRPNLREAAKTKLPDAVCLSLCVSALLPVCLYSMCVVYACTGYVFSLIRNLRCTYHLKGLPLTLSCNALVIVLFAPVLNMIIFN